MLFFVNTEQNEIWDLKTRTIRWKKQILLQLARLSIYLDMFGESECIIFRKCLNKIELLGKVCFLFF